MLQVGARLSLKAGRYAEALGMVEAALKLTSEFNLNGLARLNYMRGKILQAAAHPAARLTFPFSAIKVDAEVCVLTSIRVCVPLFPCVEVSVPSCACISLTA